MRVSGILPFFSFFFSFYFIRSEMEKEREGEKERDSFDLISKYDMEDTFPLFRNYFAEEERIVFIVRIIVIIS